MDMYESLQFLALSNVVREEPTHEYTLRRILRWYSKTFSTPLHQVDALPLDQVLTAYYESHYEEMEHEQLQSEISRLLKTPEETKQEQTKQDITEAENYEFEKQMKLEKDSPSTIPASPRPLSPSPATLSKETKLPITKVQPVLPDIIVKFEEISQLLDDDALCSLDVLNLVNRSNVGDGVKGKTM